MTAHVLALAGDAPGRGGTHPVLALAARTCQKAIYDYNFGTDNYTNDSGVDISAIWDDFKEVYYIGIEQMDTSTASEKRAFNVDYTNQLLMVYDAITSEQNTGNIGFVTLRLKVVGIK
jgi:hypothetical protein